MNFEQFQQKYEKAMNNNVDVVQPLSIDTMDKNVEDFIFSPNYITRESPMNINKVHVLIQANKDIWVGQCVEHDICVQADSLTDLRKVFKQTAYAEMRNGPLSLIGPPPQKYLDIFQKGGNSDWRVISIML